VRLEVLSKNKREGASSQSNINTFLGEVNKQQN
jgi:hypothetical protein